MYCPKYYDWINFTILNSIKIYYYTFRFLVDPPITLEHEKQVKDKDNDGEPPQKKIKTSGNFKREFIVNNLTSIFLRIFHP